jgi:hypothetical protein
MDGAAALEGAIRHQLGGVLGVQIHDPAEITRVVQSGANRLAKAMFTALRDRAVEIPDDPELVSELQTARMVETGPGTVKLQNAAGTHDDPVVAVGMTVVDLLDRMTGLPGTFGGGMSRSLLPQAPTGDVSALRRDAARPAGWGRTAAPVSRAG